MHEIWLVRHGETEWSLSGQHTGRTDIPLTPAGREKASRLQRLLGGSEFSLVLSSPLSRALETCRLAGFEDRVEPDYNLLEWDYGVYEGRTSAEIRAGQPDWSIWSAPVPGGESLEEVGARADRVIKRALTAQANVLLFAHGHILRVLAAHWLGLPNSGGRLFSLTTGSVSILGYERENRVISLWNRTPAEDGS